MRKTAKFTKPKMSKITHNFFFENVKNRATFVEGFRLEVYARARGRFIKYSMSVTQLKASLKQLALCLNIVATWNTHHLIG